MGYEAFAIPKGPVFYAVERELARRKDELANKLREIELLEVNARILAAEQEAARVLALPPPEPRQSEPGLDEIRAVVFAHLKVSRTEFQSNRRDRRIVDARAIAFWIARKHTSMSFPQIGRRYGRDHTTIIASTRRTDEHLAEYSADIAAVEALLGVA
jgi:chromosomal replication initiation ATPase DnaA